MRSSLTSFLRPVLAACVVAGLIPAGAGWPLAQAQSADAAVEPVDRVIAVVNNEVITARELDAEVAMVRQRAGPGLPEPAELEDRVLERIIIDRAQMQAARERGIVVNEFQIDRALERIAAENNLTAAQMRDRLRGDGLSMAQFREDIRGQITKARLREAVVESQVQVSDADINAWLAEQEGKKKQAVQLQVAQLLLQVSESASAEVLAQKQQLASDLLERLRQGADFKTLVAEYSDAPNAAANGGELGWRTLEQLPRLFADAVRSLRDGEIAPVVRSPAGLHLLKVVGRRGEPDQLDKPIQQTQVRHILIRPSASLSEDEIRRRLESIRERVLAGNVSFEAMAKQYSVDGSAANGGALGWVYAGDTVPEFERAMDALQPGQISAPIRTQFGFHLIEVLDRREDAASPERQRQAARRALFESRSDAAWGEWLDELRARTYVEKRFEQ